MNIFRIGAFVLFIGLVIFLVVKHQGNPEITQGVDLDADGNLTGNVLDAPMMFLWYTLTAILGGFLFVTYVLPLFGEAVGTAVLSSGEKAEPDPFAKAHSKVAIGDYEGAIAAFQSIAREEPGNRRPIAEITRLYLEKLHEPDKAIATVEKALEREWDDEDRAFFMFRLVDLTLEHRNDRDHAVEILQEVLERFPDSRHAANATHRLRDIDPSLVAATVAKPSAPTKEGAQPDLPPPSIPTPSSVPRGPTPPRHDAS